MVATVRDVASWSRGPAVAYVREGGLAADGWLRDWEQGHVYQTRAAAEG